MSERPLSFADRIRILREANGMTRAAFAEALTVSTSTVAAWELGYPCRPRILVFARMADRWGVTSEWLFTGNGTPPPTVAAQGSAPPS